MRNAHNRARRSAATVVPAGAGVFARLEQATKSHGALPALTQAALHS